MKLTPERCAEFLVKNIHDQVERYGILSALSKRQLALVRQNRAAGLDVLVAKREYQIARIEVLLRESEGYKCYWRDTHEQWPTELRQTVEGAIKTLQQVLGAVARLDAHLRIAIEERMNEYRKDLGQLRASRKVHNAYAQPRPATLPHYTDKQG